MVNESRGTGAKGAEAMSVDDMYRHKIVRSRPPCSLRRQCSLASVSCPSSPSHHPRPSHAVSAREPHERSTYLWSPTLRYANRRHFQTHKRVTKVPAITHTCPSRKSTEGMPLQRKVTTETFSLLSLYTPITPPAEVLLYT